VVDETHQVYKGQVIMQHVEWLSAFNEWRHTQSILRIKVRFQRFASVSLATEITVFNLPNVVAAITKQIVSINIADPALIELVTIVSYPYKLASDFILAGSPAGKIFSTAYAMDDCTGVINQGCKQRWRTALTLTENTCTLDGDYSLAYTKICSTAEPNCPLQEKDKKASIGYSLISENFCAEVTVEVGLTGTLAVFEDKDYIKPRTAYIVGTRAYFLVRVESDLNKVGSPDVVQFSDTKLVTVSVRREGEKIPIRLIEKTKVVIFLDVDTDPKAAIAIDDRTDGKQVGFNFVFSKELSSLLKANSKTTFTIAAEVQVTYVNSQKKRFANEVLAEESEADTYAGTAEIEDPDNTNTGSATSGSGTSGSATTGSGKTESSNAIAVCASFLLMIVALF
jgi:hypothetical protein